MIDNGSLPSKFIVKTTSESRYIYYYNTSDSYKIVLLVSKIFPMVLIKFYIYN